MTIDEKRQLGAMIEKLNPDQLEQVMDIMNVKENEVEVDIMDLDQITLRKLRAYVNQCLGVGKKKHDKDRNYVPKPKKNKRTKSFHKVTNVPLTGKQTTIKYEIGLIDEEKETGQWR